MKTLFCSVLVYSAFLSSSLFSQTSAYFQLLGAGSDRDKDQLLLWIEVPSSQEAWKLYLREGDEIFGFQAGKLTIRTEERFNPKTGIMEVIDRSFVPLKNLKSGETFLVSIHLKTKIDFQPSEVPKRPRKT